MPSLETFSGFQVTTVGQRLSYLVVSSLEGSTRFQPVASNIWSGRKKNQKKNTKKNRGTDGLRFHIFFFSSTHSTRFGADFLSAHFLRRRRGFGDARRRLAARFSSTRSPRLGLHIQRNSMSATRSHRTLAEPTQIGDSD